MSKFYTCIIAFILFSFQIQATNYYVNDGSSIGDIYCTAIGNAGNTGLTKANPKLTLTSILTAYSASFVAGDTIFIDSGNYNETQLSSPINGIVIQGAGELKTIIKNTGADDYFMLINDNNTVVSNLKLTGYNNQTISGVQALGVAANTSGVKIINVQVDGSATSSTTGGYPIEIGSGASVQLIGGGVTCNTWDGGGGIQISGASTNVYIKNYQLLGNYQLSNNGTALKINNGIVTVYNSRFENNTIGGDLSGMAIDVTLGTVNVYDSYFANNQSNILSNNIGGAVSIHGGTFKITRSVFSENVPESATSGIYGAGIGVTGGTVTIDSCGFAGNIGARANDVYVKGGAVIAHNSTFASAASQIGIAGGTFSIATCGTPSEYGAGINHINTNAPTYTANPNLPDYLPVTCLALPCTTPTITSSVPTNTICSGSVFSTNLSASTTAAQTNYSWTSASVSGITGHATSGTGNINETLTNTSAGPLTLSYSITPTFNLSCNGPVVVYTVTVSPVTTLTVSSSTICAGTTATVTPGGAATYTVQPGNLTGTTFTFSPNNSTSYTLSGLSANGCPAANQSFSVNINPLPTLTLTASSATLCAGHNTVLNASGANSYTWSPASSLSSVSGSSVTATPGTSVSYTLNATSALGCLANQSITIQVNTLPTLTLTAGISTVCVGSTTSLTASGANSYTWTPAGTLSSTSGAVVTASPANTTTYTVTATDGNGCENNQSISINTNPLPSLTLTANSYSICSGSSTTLTASGADSYTWSPATDLSNPTNASTSASPAASTVYSVTGTYSLTGCQSSSSLSVAIIATPTLSISPSSAYSICTGDSVNLSVTGASTYTWSPTTSLNNSVSANVIASPTASIVYNVSGTSAAGCTSAVSSASITVNYPSELGMGALPSSICIGSSTIIKAAGSGLNYSWSPAGSLSSSTGSIVTASPTVTTEYYVTGTNTNGCSKTDSLKITVNPTPTVSISSIGLGNSQTVCSGNPVNAITFNTAPGILISWINSNTTIGIAATGSTNIAAYQAPVLTASNTGTLTVVATDTSTGCSSSAITAPAYIITINPLPLIAASYSLTPGGCGGYANGCISGVSSQSPGTYQYSWNNGASWSANSQNCNIPAGTYTVSVKDQNNCIATENISLPTANAPALPAVSGLSASACVGDGIQLSIVLPQASISYSWTTVSATHTGTTFTINALNPNGIYTINLSVADTNHCEHDTSLHVIVNALPKPVINGNTHFCKGTGSMLTVSPNNTGDSYQWNLAGTAINGANAASYSATTGGIFSVLVTNSFGCKHDTSISIQVDSVPSAPTVTSGTSNNTYCQGSSLNPIQVNGTGTFTWYADPALSIQVGTGSPFTPSVTASSTLYVTASTSLCTGNATPVPITINPTPATPIISGQSAYVICQNQKIPTFTAIGSSTILWYSNATLTHLVDTGYTYTASGLQVGLNTYYLIDSLATGCKSVGAATASIEVHPTPYAPLTPTVAVYCQYQTINPIVVKDTNSVAGTVVWYSNPALTNTINTGLSYTPGILPLDTTTYYLLDSTAFGCKSVNTAIVSIIVHAAPVTPTLLNDPDFKLCQGSSIPTFSTNLSSTTGTVLWYNNAALVSPAIHTGTTFTPSTYTVGVPTIYYIVDTSSFGCKSSGTATVSLTVYPKPIISGLANTISTSCGKTNGSISGLSVSNGTKPYNYEWINSNGVIVGDSVNLSNIGTGTYSLVVIDIHQCKDSSSGSGFVIGSSVMPVANFIPSIQEGHAPLAVTFSNTSIEASAYSWDFGTNNAVSTQVNPPYTYTASGEYTVTLVAFNNNGLCPDTIRKTITVDITETVIVPNIFSPNGDGINDAFFITCTNAKTLHCDIFNRWGQLIYTLNALNQAWDGQLNNGNWAPDGEYFYILNIVFIDNKEYKANGVLTLIK